MCASPPAFGRFEHKILRILMNKTDELRTARIESLVTPAELAQRHPVSLAVAEHVTQSVAVSRNPQREINGY